MILLLNSISLRSISSIAYHFLPSILILDAIGRLILNLIHYCIRTCGQLLPIPNKATCLVNYDVFILLWIPISWTCKTANRYTCKYMYNNICTCIVNRNSTFCEDATIINYRNTYTDKKSMLLKSNWTYHSAFVVRNTDHNARGCKEYFGTDCVYLHDCDDTPTTTRMNTVKKLAANTW